MDTDTAAAGIGIGGAAIGGLLTGLGAWIFRLLQTRHDHGRQIRKDTIDELYSLNQQLRKDLDELQKELSALQKEHMECQVQYTRLLERMTHYEEVLENNKIPFRPFRPGGVGTDTHTPLSGGGAK